MNQNEITSSLAASRAMQLAADGRIWDGVSQEASRGDFRWDMAYDVEDPEPATIVAGNE